MKFSQQEQKFSDPYDNLDLSDEQRKVINHWINYGINRSEVTNVKACKNPIILAGLVNQDISLLSPSSTSVLVNV